MMQQPTDSQARFSLLHRSLARRYPVAQRGEGSWIVDTEGKRYLDLAGSAAVNFIGHGNREVTEAVRKQLAKIEFVHSSQFQTEIAERFAEEVLEFAGASFRGGGVFFTSGGSEAVETALKFARQYQVEIGEHRRKEILARNQAYHGSTFGAMAVSGNRSRREIYLPMLPECARVNTPCCYRCVYGCKDCATNYALEVERQLQERGKRTAAFIFEPVSGATLGAAIPPSGYLQHAVAACRAEGVLVIADEVMTGFGRTGANFAVNHWAVEPDLLVVAKGIASGYAALGAVIVNRKVVDAIAKGSGTLVHGFTYNNHPAAMAAGRAVLECIRQRNLVRAADSAVEGSVAHRFKIELLKLNHCRSVGDVRGIGLLWGIEFVCDKPTKMPFKVEQQFASKVSAAATRRGVMVYPMQGCVDGVAGDHLLLAPPAILSADEIQHGVEQLRASIEETEQSFDL